MAKVRRIPTLEITEAAQERIDRLCERLGIEDPRELINRALNALEVMVEAADPESNEVLVSNPRTPDATRRVRLGR